jgi:hypothetical protein
MIPGIGNMYIGIIALVINLVVAAVVTLILTSGKTSHGVDTTVASDYEDAPGIAR